MTGLRTLPIRVEPNAGEALDSWLETLAFRMRMPAGDLLRSVGLTRPADRQAPEIPRKNWMIQLLPGEADSVAAVTGIPARQAMTMTLAAYDRRALIIDPQSREVNRHRLWGRNAGSRYCPHCLAENGGRWNLSWRLGWSFACLRHRCLLADSCPQCNRIQRQFGVRGIRVSHPAHCGYAAAGGTPRTRCGSDLREAVTVCFCEGHPVLDAQRLVEETIQSGRASFGVYTQRPTASRFALADVKAIAARALARDNAHAIDGRLPADLLDAYHQAHAAAPIRPGAQPSFAWPGRMAPSQAAVAAAGVLAAIGVLGRPSISDARHALRWLTLDARARGRTVNSSTASWGRGTSPVLPALILGSIQPDMRPSQQLRYRVLDDWPGLPDSPASRLDVLTRSTPALFWPSWALRLASPGVSIRLLRAVLSALSLLPGTRAMVKETTSILGSVTDEISTSRVLRLLEAQPQWRHILTALIRLADYLAAHPAPIDYLRRRALAYDRLLPCGEWDQICRATGATPGHGYKVLLARAYLHQRLSCLPFDIPPAAVTAPAPAFRLDVALFPARLFPELASRLDAAGQHFLASQGISGEPATWQPPPGLIDDLELPGTDPAAINRGDIHQLIYSGETVSKAARALGTTHDVLLAILAEDPTPARRIVYGQGALAGPRAHPPEIPWDELEQLYLRERLSTRQLAARYNVNREVIAKRLREHGVTPGRRPPAGLTADWLGREYADKGRSFDDLAAEVNFSASSLARWARKYGIPVRSAGAPRSPGDGAVHSHR